MNNLWGRSSSEAAGSRISGQRSPRRTVSSSQLAPRRAGRSPEQISSLFRKRGVLSRASNGERLELVGLIERKPQRSARAPQRRSVSSITHRRIRIVGLKAGTIYEGRPAGGPDHPAALPGAPKRSACARSTRNAVQGAASSSVGPSSSMRGYWWWGAPCRVALERLHGSRPPSRSAGTTSPP